MMNEQLPKTDDFQGTLDNIEEGIKGALNGQGKTRAAMTIVDRKADHVALTIEALIDQVIHCRIMETLGKYLTGPRDARIRRLLVATAMSISSDNANSMDN
jgi:hypothetical protein